LTDIFPILAIVESKPKYERVPAQDQDSLKGDTKIASDAIEEPDASAAKPITASIRDIHSLLWSISGFRSLFRNILCFTIVALVQTVLAAALESLPVVPKLLDGTVAALLTIQLPMLWMHLVISAPSEKSTMSRMPRFITAFRASAIPVFITFLIVFMAQLLPLFLVLSLGAKIRQPIPGLHAITFEPQTEAWKIIIYYLLQLVLLAIFYIPVHAALVRINASLLPGDDETIIPVDRTFGVDEAHEKGYLTFRQALRSMKGDWARLYKLWAKVFFIGLGFELLLGLFFALQLIAASLYFKH
jgi:hypothetical protein